MKPTRENKEKFEITEEELDIIKESSWLNGERAANLKALSNALRLLMYGDEFTRERLIKEREETIAALRSICDEFGDNDWTEELYLPDVINNHLKDHLIKGTTD